MTVTVTAIVVLRARDSMHVIQVSDTVWASYVARVALFLKG
jgi:hypothetical protein